MKYFKFILLLLYIHYPMTSMHTHTINLHNDDTTLNTDNLAQEDTTNSNSHDTQEHQLIDTAHYTYNAKGQIVHELLDDGSQRLFEYDDDGTITTTIIDPLQIQQQVIIEKPDKSVITKNYNTLGKLTSIEIKHTDGSYLQKTYNKSGDLLTSAIQNKHNQLESTTQLDEYGRRTTTIYNPDQSINRFATYNPDTTYVHPDGTQTTVHVNPEGIITQHTRDSNYNLISTMIQKPDGTQRIFHYDPITHQINFINLVTIDEYGYRVGTQQDAYGNNRVQLFYDPDNHLISKTIFYPNNSSKIYFYEFLTGQIQSIVTEENDEHGNNIRITRNKDNKISTIVTRFVDGTFEMITYNEQEEPITKTMYDATWKEIKNDKL